MENPPIKTVVLHFSLKRDTTKLNPADMLALVALVEAGERARKESDVESSGPVPMIASDDLEYMPQGTWLDAPVQAQPSMVDYYGMPLEAQNQVIPKYEYVPRQHKYSGVNSRKFNHTHQPTCMQDLVYYYPQDSGPRNSDTWWAKRSVRSIRANF